MCHKNVLNSFTASFALCFSLPLFRCQNYFVVYLVRWNLLYLGHTYEKFCEKYVIVTILSFRREIKLLVTSGLATEKPRKNHYRKLLLLHYKFSLREGMLSLQRNSCYMQKNILTRLNTLKHCHTVSVHLMSSDSYSLLKAGVLI